MLRQEIESNSAFCIKAMQLALPVLDLQEVKRTLKVLSDDKDTLRQAIIGTGLSGDPAYIPWLIKHMENPVYARIAGEAFSYLCGVDLAYQDLEEELPEGDLGGPTEDPEDENVAMDSDEDLPCPDPQLVQQWWLSNKADYKPAVRYLYGKPCDKTQCEWVLRHGTQRLRFTVALKLALIYPQQAVYEVRAMGKRQQETLNVNAINKPKV